MKLFRRRRDGRISVHLNNAGRDFIEQICREILDAEFDDDGVIHPVLYSRITPELEHDSPERLFQRQDTVSALASQTLRTVPESVISDDDAWAWLRTIQVSLRSHAYGRDIRRPEDLADVDPEVARFLADLQTLAWALATALSD